MKSFCGTQILAGQDPINGKGHEILWHNVVKIRVILQNEDASISYIQDREIRFDATDEDQAAFEVFRMMARRLIDWVNI